MLSSSAFARIRTGLRQAACLVVVGVFCGAAANVLRPNGLPLIRASTLPDSAAQLSQGIQTIALLNARKLFEEERVLFLDARDPAAFSREHLPGALNVPPGNAAAMVEELRAIAEAGLHLVAYCDGSRCPLSTELAAALQDLGVEAAVLVDGLQRWKGAGLPTEGEP
jgi:rhodanese-related sulfurtransferase